VTLNILHTTRYPLKDKCLAIDMLDQNTYSYLSDVRRVSALVE
jgi:hypothetical protein